ncbi:hypothetical protein ACFFV7_36555 [Nonomuraea spiralis]|uniref:Uncharacterized protein n=1 Tax=Nonomuraea spiralis TaxID=46182 RepID=A0ABV5IQD7_9ACTN|nr:hypothetical protein [Nonomuraea spiralis]
MTTIEDNQKTRVRHIALCDYALVTLVFSLHSRYTMWLVADRRLSYGANIPPIDDAVKILNLETTDGVGLLAYAGLGATSQGTQPSEWMKGVLRGRGGLTFEQALGVLSSAANRELPRHLIGFPKGASRSHSIISPAFIRGVGARLYSIDTVIENRKTYHRYTSHQHIDRPGSPCLRLAAGGTGAGHLNKIARQDVRWRRDLLGLLNAHDHGKISDYLIADRLAKISYETHQAVPATVGPRCIVVWRRRQDMRQPTSGGGHQFYTGTDRDKISDAIPTITNGIDIQSIAGIFMDHFMEKISEHGMKLTDSELDTAKLNRLLAKLPSEPDEKLR